MYIVTLKYVLHLRYLYSYNVKHISFEMPLSFCLSHIKEMLKIRWWCMSDLMAEILPTWRLTQNNQSINHVRLKFQEEFSTKSSEMLFGKDCTVHKAFDLLDKDKNGEVSGFIFVQCRYMAEISWIWHKTTIKLSINFVVYDMNSFFLHMIYFFASNGYIYIHT